MSIFLVKKGGAETTKMDHLRNVHFGLENAGGAALECVVFLGEECLFRMFIIHQRITGGRLHLFL